MKNFLLACLLLPLFVFGQKSPPNMYEVTTMRVKRGMDDKFIEAVKAHDQKYHAEGMYTARLAYNISGPQGGTYSWIMGPSNWAAMDTRPGKGAHDEDWKNVDQYVESYNPPSYWSYSEKLSHIVSGKNTDKRVIWAYNLKSGKGARWSELIQKVKEVYEKKLPDESFWVVWNKMAAGKDGVDVCLIFGSENWGALDRDRDFGDLYEEVHGNGTWHTFLNEFNETVEERTDWLREMVN